jgi:hypothetical protein
LYHKSSASLPFERRNLQKTESLSVTLTADGRLLLVANALPAGRADRPPVGAEVSLVDTSTGTVASHLCRPNGSTGLRQIRISPDGQLAAVSHLMSRYFVPATQPDRGWIQTNAVSLIDVANRKLLGTFLLDEIDRGGESVGR